ncbi:right-handed parallel beta-helix repeat-containing protein [Leifsonia flava]|uniref:Right-handed parallel beta-helix repeat-containing protein n=1 Tax=Orlajensenia leifsoniae TaxID=2561933 RepID=A0A4Y9R0V7_9MICO|nr:right-handed parallel beta-helix repeat-containing protein [Leifsonia flava]TFV98319.1 right-handed parallel beta-helix repeat-containing protein [Leifsonia flava]
MRQALRVSAATLGIAALGAALVLLPTAGALGASPPDTIDTGDPPPPADPSTPGGVDAPSPDPDETVVEMPPPVSPEIVSNANTVRMAWVGTPDERPADAALLTLQAAINAATTDDTVSFDSNDYAFTGALSVTKAVTLDTATDSLLYSRFTVSDGGLTLADDVAIGAANTGAVITVTTGGAVLSNITVRNPTPVLRPTGIQLGAGITDVVIEGLDMDGNGEASSYGVNLTTGSATITDPSIVGVAVGVTATAASTAGGVSISGGSIAAATTGVSLGTATTPTVTGLAVTGPGSAGTGIDLAKSSGAVVTGATVSGYARGIGAATTNVGLGPTITDAVVTGTFREGISLGATSDARVVRPKLTGTDALQSTGILTLMATGVVIEQPTISGVQYGISTSSANTGSGPEISAPTITAFGGITLGSTQGAIISDAVLDSGTWAGGTGINTVNAGRVTITDETATGFLYAIGSQSNFDPDSDRVDISISDLTVTGAANASNAVYLLGVENASIENVTADITGAALVIHQSVGVNARNITVTGHEGPTSVTGAAILRAYGSQDVNVDTASIDAGSYGFFYSATDGSTITNATVANLLEYGVYGRSVANLDLSGVTFTGNSAVGLLVVTTPANGISHDVDIHDNTMSGNDSGIQVLQGTTDVEIHGNTVSGQPDVVTAGGAHNLVIAENTIDQVGSPSDAAIAVAPLWEDGAVPGSYSSSGIEITGNTFRGGGTWLRVGTVDGTSDEAARRTLSDPIRFTGNSVPADSTAIVTLPNAVVGADTATPAEIAPLVAVADGPVAVDARDYDDPNDWGAACRATGFLDGALYYDGGGAQVQELTEAPVLYPMTCIDLSLTEGIEVDSDQQFGIGDTVTWSLTPHNDGPRAAPAGWTVSQLLPDGVELVSIAGDGYMLDGATATAAAELPSGEDGPSLTVVVRIITAPPGESTMHNVAYTGPAAVVVDLDGDGFADPIVEQTSPLVVPTIDTDTDASETDNDAQGSWVVVVDEPTPEPPAPGPPLPEPPGTGGVSDSGADPAAAGGLSSTGSDPVPLLLAAAMMLLAGIGAVVVGRRRLS